jgi:transmembrane sensor
MDQKDHEIYNSYPRSTDEGVVFGAAIRRVVDDLHVSPNDIEISYGQAQAKIHGAAAKTIQETIQGKPQRAPYRSVRLFSAVGTLRWGVWYTLAGVAAGMLAITSVWHLGASRLNEHRQLAMSSYVTGNGERANVTLPDGSTASLSAASRLDVPADYLAGNHTVRLRGEALFTVRHHDGAPFTVIAGSATTRVLGTSFLARYYAVDSATTVAVHDGKVAVYAAADVKPVVLMANQQVIIDRGGSANVKPADPGQFSFAAGVLTLKSVPFPVAIPELDRWYDADIRLGDPTLRAQRITGECAAGSLTDLTSILELTFNVRVVRDGRVLTLFSR